MRVEPLILAVICGLGASCGFAESRPTNSFGVYLFAEPEDWRGDGSNWTSRALSPRPVISEADILTYTWTNHRMTLRSEAAQRIARVHISGLVEPFVVVVNGE